MLNLKVRCVQLDSESGRKLNGQTGTVFGVGSRAEAHAAVKGGPPYRVNVRLDSDASKLLAFFHILVSVSLLARALLARTNG